MNMTRRMIREAREFERAWIKAGRPRNGFKMIMSESMRNERPRVSPVQRFKESYANKTPKTTTAYQAFHAAYDAALGKARWPSIMVEGGPGSGRHPEGGRKDRSKSKVGKPGLHPEELAAAKRNADKYYTPGSPEHAQFVKDQIKVAKRVSGQIKSDPWQGGG